MTNESTPYGLYRKLRPVLRVKHIGNDRFEASRRTPEDRDHFYVRCHRFYCDGGYYGGLEWDPKGRERAVAGEVVVGAHPTYDQFCTWYRLDPGEGLDDLC